MATPRHPFEPALKLETERALAGPIGAASPLWFAFFGVAATATSWWWMTRWAREFALDGAASASAAADIPVVIAENTSFAPVDEAAEAAETVAEAAGLVFDPVIEGPVAVAPQIIAPVLPEPETVAAVADDLTRLVGIGPKLAVALAERGVTTFAQIAAWQGKDLDEVDKALSLKGRAARDAWVSQARRLAAGQADDR